MRAHAYALQHQGIHRWCTIHNCALTLLECQQEAVSVLQCLATVYMHPMVCNELNTLSPKPKICDSTAGPSMMSTACCPSKNVFYAPSSICTKAGHCLCAKPNTILFILSCFINDSCAQCQNTILFILPLLYQ